MPDDDSGFGITRGLKNLLSRDVKSDEEGGGEVIALAGHAAARAEVVPAETKPAVPVQLSLALEGEASLPIAARPARHTWAWLLQRVFAVDILTCPMCKSTMVLKEVATKPASITRALADAGLGPRPPPKPRPASPGQLLFGFAVEAARLAA